MCSNRISSHLEGYIYGSPGKHIPRQCNGIQNLSKHFKNKRIQTDYRDSDCQTSPWEPPYQISPGNNPEVLMLKHFRWDVELPAGMHELEIINRMRKRRAWERILPPMDTPANIKIRSALLVDLENDEWAFREAEIQFLMNLRMDLEEISMQFKANQRNKQTEDRFEKLNESHNKRKQKEINSIRNIFSRELRKLAIKHKSIRTGKEKSNIVELHVKRNLAFNNPKLHHGCVAENYYEKTFLDIVGIQNEETSADWLCVVKEPNYIAAKSFMRICPRVSKRNNKKLIEISKNLETMKCKLEFSDTYDLLKPKQKIPLLPTLYRLSAKRSEDDIYLTSSFLQKLLKQRTHQCMIFEEKCRYKELIEDLRLVEVLKNLKNLSSETMHLKLKQLIEKRKTLQESGANEISHSIEGKTIVKTLIFLNNELTRLHTEAANVPILYNQRLKREKAQIKEEFEVERNKAVQALDKKNTVILVKYVD